MNEIHTGTYISPEQYEIYANILKVIAHPVRLCIVKELIEKGGANVSTIYSALGIPQSTVSQHLAKLRTAGLVTGDRRGNEIIYTVESEEANRLINCMIKSTQKLNEERAALEALKAL